MPEGSNISNRRMRYTRQTIVTNTFFQMPRFLTAGEFAGSSLSNNARILYTLLLDRHRLSIKNGWFDDNGEVYIYFKREEMGSQLGLSDRTVSKVMQELKDFFLVEEKKQGLNKPNKIYLLSPIIGNDESPEPYLDPDTDYDPENGYDSEALAFAESYNERCMSEPEIFSSPEAKDLRPRTRKNCASEPEEFTTTGGEKFTVLDPQNLGASNNKLNNNQKRNNHVSNNEGSKTATAAPGNRAGANTPPKTAAAEAATPQTRTSPSIPYSQILGMYNGLCETQGLRPIQAITDKRKTQTAARFKEYGLSGFSALFEKVAASVFLCGGGDRGWKADYDWLIVPANMQKVLEGKYDNDQCNTPMPQLRLEEPYPAQGAQNKQERHDPFLERAMTAYATAQSV